MAQQVHDKTKSTKCLNCGYEFEKGTRCPECGRVTIYYTEPVKSWTAPTTEEYELFMLQGMIWSGGKERPVGDDFKELVKMISESLNHFYNVGWADAKYHARKLSEDYDKAAHIAMKLLDILAAMGIRNELRDILAPLFQVAPDLIARMQKCYKDRNGPEASDGGPKDGNTSRETNAESSSEEKEKEEDDKA